VEEVVVRAAQEIIRYLSTVPSMKKSFENLEFANTLKLEPKLKMIVGLIRGLSEIDEFH
jgi:hypothetical protein